MSWLQIINCFIVAEMASLKKQQLKLNQQLFSTLSFENQNWTQASNEDACCSYIGKQVPQMKME